MRWLSFLSDVVQVLTMEQSLQQYRSEKLAAVAVLEHKLVANGVQVGEVQKNIWYNYQCSRMPLAATGSNIVATASCVSA